MKPRTQNNNHPKEKTEKKPEKQIAKKKYKIAAK